MGALINRNNNENVLHMITSPFLLYEIVKIFRTVFLQTVNFVTYRAYEVWGGPEGLAKEIWDRKKAYEESERYRKGI